MFSSAAAAGGGVRGGGGGRKGGGGRVSDCMSGCVYYRVGPGSTLRFAAVGQERRPGPGEADYASVNTAGTQATRFTR